MGKKLNNKYLLISINRFRNCNEIQKAVVMSIIIGLLITVVLFIEKKEENSSSIYIYPDSYTNYPEGNTISFIFGIESREKERTTYDLEILIDDILLEKNNLQLEPREKYEEKKVLKIPEVIFPAKIRLMLKSPTNKTYDSFFWLKKGDEEKKTTPLKTPDSRTSSPILIPDQDSILSPDPTPDQNSILSPNSTPDQGSILSPNSTPFILEKNFTAVMLDRAFNPKVVNISVGGKVMWVNRDTLERKITLISRESLFTQEINIDKRFVYTFNTSGVYTFYLNVLPEVEGRVIVS